MTKRILWLIWMAILALGFSPILVSATVMQLSSPGEFSPGAVTTDFEGLSGWLSDQIPHFTFHYSQVVDPATIGNSLGWPLSAATSGTAAVHSFGERIDFGPPVNEVGMFVSPSFITYIPGIAPVYVDMFLAALDASDSQIGVVSVSVLRATGSITDVESFTPVFLGLRSDMPISAVTVDWELPLNPSGAALFFDDLTICRVRTVRATLAQVWWRPSHYTLDNPVPDPWQARLFGPPHTAIPAADIDPATILLEGMFSPLGPPNEPYLTFRDFELVVSFDGYDVLTAILLKAGYLIPGENNPADLVITGQTYEGTPFRGTGRIQMYVPAPPPP